MADFLKVIADSQDFRALVRALAHNALYDMGVTVGNFSIKVTKNLDIAEKILSFFMPSRNTTLRIVRNSRQIIIYDCDILLNRKFLQIFGTIPKGVKEARLGLSLKI